MRNAFCYFGTVLSSPSESIVVYSVVPYFVFEDGVP